MYDVYLHENKIEHSHEVPVEGLPYIADFRLSDRFVEVAGMMHYRKYHQKFDRKMGDYARAGVSVQYLFEHDVRRLYATCSSSFTTAERICVDCGKKTIDIVNLKCRPCNRRQWGRDNSIKAICSQCEQVFDRKAGTEALYCSRKCYWRSMESNWPAWEWIDERLKMQSVRSLALELGVKPNSFYMRLRRRPEVLTAGRERSTKMESGR